MMMMMIIIISIITIIVHTCNVMCCRHPSHLSDFVPDRQLNGSRLLHPRAPISCPRLNLVSPPCAEIRIVQRRRHRGRAPQHQPFCAQLLPITSTDSTTYFTHQDRCQTPLYRRYRRLLQPG
ncbi:hypothetical protein LY76DRAFT_418881 [Colletotrichum caudatum]|nr:hypothetical protein LY76DRAFT_418881 [Colletotrichum caudatum]